MALALPLLSYCLGYTSYSRILLFSFIRGGGLFSDRQQLIVLTGSLYILKVTHRLSTRVKYERLSDFYFGCGSLGYVFNGRANKPEAKMSSLDSRKAFGNWMKPNRSRMVEYKWNQFTQLSEPDRNESDYQEEGKEDVVDLANLA